MRTRFISLLTISLVLLFLALGGIADPWFAQAAENNPDAANTMSIVVQFSNSDRLIRKVEFSEPTISGLQALLNSGLDVVTSEQGWGIAVCSIEGVGCPADNCFCGSKFWSYQEWDGNQWQYHSSGAGSTSRSNGDVDGWKWSEFSDPPIAFPYPQLERAWNALRWLQAQQNSDGGYGTPSSATSSSVESLLAIAANHYKAADWRKDNSASMLGYMMANGASFTKSAVGAAGKFAVGASAAQLCMPFQAETPSGFYDPSTGRYHQDAGPQAWAILGTAALSETVPADAVTYLKNLALPGGGWEWSSGWTADTNTTALAIQALVAAGVDPTDSVIVGGLNFIKTAQNNDGGFTYDPDSSWGTDSDTNSTAYVLQALYAVGQDPTSAAWQKNGKTALDFLATVQLGDGSFEWQPSLGSNLLATQQAIPALLGRPAPFSVSDVEGCKVSFMPLVSR